MLKSSSPRKENSDENLFGEQVLFFTMKPTVSSGVRKSKRYEGQSDFYSDSKRPLKNKLLFETLKRYGDRAGSREDLGSMPTDCVRAFSGEDLLASYLKPRAHTGQSTNAFGSAASIVTERRDPYESQCARTVGQSQLQLRASNGCVGEHVQQQRPQSMAQQRNSPWEGSTGRGESTTRTLGGGSGSCGAGSEQNTERAVTTTTMHHRSHHSVYTRGEAKVVRAG